MAEVERPEPRRLAPPMAVVDEVESEQPSIDLTREFVFVDGTAEPTIIDTTTVQPQIQADTAWTGRVRFTSEFQPPHWRDKTLRDDGPNTLPLGGIVGPSATRGINQYFTGITQTPWSPPDPAIAVGPNHIVETVNMAIAFYTKDGTLLFSQNLDSTGNPGFFEEVGSGNFTFDPKCFYDHITGRFVVVALEVYTGSREAYIAIAVSDDSDPNGKWYKYRTDAKVRVGNSDYWVDYPGMGYDDKAWYINGNLFGFSSGFAGVLFRAYDKTAMLNGQPAQYKDVRDGNAASVQSAQSYGTPRAGFFVSVNSGSSLRVHAIKDPTGSATLTSTTVTVPNFTTPRGGAPNRGGGSIDTLDGRIINVHWRDGRLYSGHGIWVNNKNVARWYELNTGNWPDSGVVTYTQGGNIDAGGSIHTWFPAIFSTASHDVGVVVAASSSTEYASVQVAGRRASDAAGTMRALTNLKTGTAGTSGRWGDYFDICLDPANNRTFWVVGEYAQSGGWATWIDGFRVSCPADLDGNGTLDIRDFFAFQALYAAGDRAADFDGNGTLDIRDFFAFQAAFAAGC